MPYSYKIPYCFWYCDRLSTNFYSFSHLKINLYCQGNLKWNDLTQWAAHVMMRSATFIRNIYLMRGIFSQFCSVVLTYISINKFKMENFPLMVFITLNKILFKFLCIHYLTDSNIMNINDLFLNNWFNI